MTCPTFRSWKRSSTSRYVCTRLPTPPTASAQRRAAAHYWAPVGSSTTSRSTHGCAGWLPPLPPVGLVCLFCTLSRVLSPESCTACRWVVGLRLQVHFAIFALHRSEQHWVQPAAFRQANFVCGRYLCLQTTSPRCIT